MRNGSPVLLGGGRYTQGPGVLHNLGTEVSYFGTKALVVAGLTAWKKAGPTIAQSLESAGISYFKVDFTGYCTYSITERLAEQARDFGAQVIIGVGGGKCLDAAKWSSDKAGLRIITVPTSVSTCAAYASLCVLYDETGATIRSEFLGQEVGAVVLDTNLIAKDCPPRMFASGIADALAKEPEIFFSIGHATNWERSVLPSIGLDISEFTTTRFFAQGLQALKDVEFQLTTSDVEDIACSNVALTGMISSLASGGKQLAIAHSIYDCVTTLFQPQRLLFLHGEIVSCGIPVQMGVNGYPQERIDYMTNYLRSLGTPTTLADLGIPSTPENIEKILNFVFQNMEITDESVRQTIRENIKRIS